MCPLKCAGMCHLASSQSRRLYHIKTQNIPASPGPLCLLAARPPPLWGPGTSSFLSHGSHSAKCHPSGVRRCGALEIWLLWYLRSSVLSVLSVICPVLLLSGTPSYGCTAVCLWKNIEIVSRFGSYEKATMTAGVQVSARGSVCTLG